MKQLEELNRMGYSLDLDCNGNIIYHFAKSDIMEVDKPLKDELFQFVREHKPEAVEYLRARSELAFVEIMDEDHPFKDKLYQPPRRVASVVSADVLLYTLKFILEDKCADTGIIAVFQRRLQNKLEKGVEYPVMLHCERCTLMLKPYEVIERYARSNAVRFRYYIRFKLLTMIFK